MERGQRLLVMGLNGAGKTSLLRIIAGLSACRYFGEAASAWRGYYAQNTRTHRQRPQRLSPPAGPLGGDRDRAANLLGMFGLVGEAFQDASTLSRRKNQVGAGATGGRAPQLPVPRRTDEQPRPAIARGYRPGAVDTAGAMVVVSHDAGFVGKLAPDRVLLMPDWDRG